MSTLSVDARAACLQESPLFQGLTLTECSEIVSIARERHFSKHQTIFREGDPVKYVFVLVSGRVKISETSRAGAEVILSIEKAGEPVGGLGLPPGGSHTRTAQALERCLVLVWAAETFQTLCDRYLALGRNSMRIMGERLRMLEERFQEMATEPLAPRLARTLVRLFEQNGNGAQKDIPIGLSREELAQMTGMTLFTVSRLLSEWEQRGIVTSRRRSVLVKDLPGLIMLTGGLP